MRTLEELTIKGFKSIREQTLKLGKLNVFIGGNGAGKSNLVQAFRFLREIVNKNLAGYVLQSGGADALLHFGQKRTQEMRVRLTFGSGGTGNGYELVLAPNNEDTLFVREEWTYYHDRNRFKSGTGTMIGRNSPEAKLPDDTSPVPSYVRRDLESYRVYHFHDTSNTAAVKLTGQLDDNRFLRSDAANLAAFLYFLKQKHPETLRNIEDTIRQIAPFFESFQLEPSRNNAERIRLEWREKASDAYFNASALSDGTLRFICLATLLMQPQLPAIVLLDEPELGLHPAAIVLLADLLTSAATRTQVIIATQSVGLVGQFSHEDVWTVDREDGQSVFKHLAKEDLSGWLEGYSLGELWEMNRLGARP
ncbi:MAG: AAA family ATPase [Opitutaceae bacterium]